jgi:hypothetical protein
MSRVDCVTLLIVILSTCGCSTAPPSRVTFVVMSQRSSRHETIASATAATLKRSLADAGDAGQRHTVVDLQKELAVKGGWTYFPIAQKFESIS